MPLLTRLAISILVALPFFEQAAAAQEPTAIVEDAIENAGVEIFDYLWPGTQIDLSAGNTLVLGYLYSCLRETIVGGRVTVGTEESTVAGGQVTREYVECHGGTVYLSEQEAETSGVTILRGDDDGPVAVYSLHPLLTFPEPVSVVTFRRLDRHANLITLGVTARRLDLQAAGRELAAGGTYEIDADGMIRVVKISVYARAGGPMVARLVRF